MPCPQREKDAPRGDVGKHCISCSASSQPPLLFYFNINPKPLQGLSWSDLEPEAWMSDSEPEGCLVCTSFKTSLFCLFNLYLDVQFVFFIFVLPRSKQTTTERGGCSTFQPESTGFWSTGSIFLSGSHLHTSFLLNLSVSWRLFQRLNKWLPQIPAKV